MSDKREESKPEVTFEAQPEAVDRTEAMAEVAEAMESMSDVDFTFTADFIKKFAGKLAGPAGTEGEAVEGVHIYSVAGEVIGALNKKLSVPLLSSAGEKALAEQAKQRAAETGRNLESATAWMRAAVQECFRGCDGYVPRYLQRILTVMQADMPARIEAYDEEQARDELVNEVCDKVLADMSTEDLREMIETRVRAEIGS